MQLWNKNWNFGRVGVIITVLVLFFAMDDLLMLYLMSKLEFLQPHSGWYWTFYLLALGGSVCLALLVFESMRRRPTLGKEGLIGERGRIIAIIAEGYQVKIMGEIWLATSEQPLAIGDEVQVVSVSGLRLTVQKLATPKNETKGGLE